MNLPLSVVGATVTVTQTSNPLTGLVKVDVPALNLPAGRTFRTDVLISATPADLMPSSTSAQVSGVTQPAVSYTYRYHRPLDTSGTVNVLVMVEEQVAGVWYVYDYVTWNGVISQAPAVLAAGSRPKFGTNVHVFIPHLRAADSLNPMLAKVAGSNITQFRASAPWSYMAPYSAAFDATAQAQCDSFATWLRANNAKWIVALAALPAGWAAQGGVVGAPPTNWADYDAFIDAFLARYGDVISVVENVNEPNGSAGFVGNNGWTWSNFATSQQHLHDRVKAYNANMLVSGPALAYGDAAYLETMYQQGFGPYMDLVNIHPYNFRFDRVGTAGANGNNNGVRCDPAIGWKDEAGRAYDLTQGIQAVAEVMANHGDSAKQILVGEWGLATSFTGPSKKQSSLDVSLAKQASQLVTAVRQVVRDSRVYAFVSYMLYDNAADAAGLKTFDIASWQQCFGMMSPMGHITKPSLAAYIDATANPT